MKSIENKKSIAGMDRTFERGMYDPVENEVAIVYSKYDQCHFNVASM